MYTDRHPHQSGGASRKARYWCNPCVALLSAVLLLAASPGRACNEPSASLAPVVDEFFTRPAAFDWQGEWLQDDDICFPSRQSGATLRAYLLAPKDIDSRDAPLPVVVIGPGSGTGQALYYLWSARALAGQGYLALAVDPQGVGRSDITGEVESCSVEGCPGIPYQDADNFVDAFASALDFLETRGHPWLEKGDLSRIGVAGHSLSARAAAFLQGEDDRIDALVAWDNLSSDLHGDAGISSGGGTCGALIGGSLPEFEPVNVRVPAMGQASDNPPGCDPENTDPEVKKTAYRYWREADTDAMQLVFAGAAHGDWAQTRNSDPAQLQLFQHYTKLWFDRYLKADELAAESLLQREVLGQPVSQLLSSAFLSAVFLPDRRIDCPRFAEGVCVPVAELTVLPITSDPLGLRLDGSASFDPSEGGMVTGYAFNPGDGNAVIHTDSGTVEHRYARGDTYGLQLVVTSANGLDSVPVTREWLINRPPKATLIASRVEGVVPLTVVLDAGESLESDANDAIEIYRFDPGDGAEPSEQASPAFEYTYNEIGVFTASVIAADTHGAASEAAHVAISVARDQPVDPPVDVGSSPLRSRSSGGGALSPLAIFCLMVSLAGRRCYGRDMTLLVRRALGGFRRSLVNRIRNQG